MGRNAAMFLRSHYKPVKIPTKQKKSPESTDIKIKTLDRTKAKFSGLVYRRQIQENRYTVFAQPAAAICAVPPVSTLDKKFAKIFSSRDLILVE